MGSAPEAFFLPMSNGRRGQRFTLHYRPAGNETRGAVVYAHPFAEEMNKSRRMAAMQARALAAAGYAVLQVDLLGCGDSSGDFRDATWDDWITDMLEAVHWMGGRHDAPLILWGLRSGCLIATEVSRRIDAPADILFWQPVHAGKVVLQQFLRLRVAAEMQSGGGKGLMNLMRTQLAAGEAVEVAGYCVGPALATGLECAVLVPPTRPSRVTWLEVSPRNEPALLPASTETIADWEHAGHHVHGAVVQGPSFWQTTEIDNSPALLDVTLASLNRIAA
jgi:uncharacterized protein